MKNIISTNRVLEAGNCDVYFCCIHSTEYVNEYSIMDATVLDVKGKDEQPLHGPERVTIVRKDTQRRADELADLIEELHGFHYVILCDDGSLHDGGGLAGICPCGEDRS